MKKLAGILALGAVALVSLAACGGNGDPDLGKKVEYSEWSVRAEKAAAAGQEAFDKGALKMVHIKASVNLDEGVSGVTSQTVQGSYSLDKDVGDDYQAWLKTLTQDELVCITAVGTINYSYALAHYQAYNPEYFIVEGSLDFGFKVNYNVKETSSGISVEIKQDVVFQWNQYGFLTYGRETITNSISYQGQSITQKANDRIKCEYTILSVDK